MSSFFKAFILFVMIILPLSSTYAFEPVSIDDFFKKYQQKSPQPTASSKKERRTRREFFRPKPEKTITPQMEQSSENNFSRSPLDAPTSSPLPKITYNPKVSGQQFSKIDILILDRILGRSRIVVFNAGQTRIVDGLFKITVDKCLERKTEYHQKIHSVPMNILTNKSAEKSKGPLYNDIFYIELPGFKGFDHPVYDIRPIKCYGKSKNINLKNYDKLQAEKQNKTEPGQNPYVNKVESIISNTHISADLN